jgi:hypothetical protein
VSDPRTPSGLEDRLLRAMFWLVGVREVCGGQGGPVPPHGLCYLLEPGAPGCRGVRSTTAATSVVSVASSESV